MALDLLKAFAEHERQRKDAAFGQRLGSIVQEGMFPFKTGDISLALEQDMDLYDFGRTLLIDIDAVRGYTFKYKFNEKELWRDAYDAEDYILQSVAEPLIKHFRYRPSLPVDDHIVLGED